MDGGTCRGGDHSHKLARTELHHQRLCRDLGLCPVSELVGQALLFSLAFSIYIVFQKHKKSEHSRLKILQEVSLIAITLILVLFLGGIAAMLANYQVGMRWRGYCPRLGEFYGGVSGPQGDDEVSLITFTSHRSDCYRSSRVFSLNTFDMLPRGRHRVRW